MATYRQINNAYSDAMKSFVDVLKDNLGEDFDEKFFYNVAETTMCDLNDYVCQSTSFRVKCGRCGVELDYEDDLTTNGCINCDK